MVVLMTTMTVSAVVVVEFVEAQPISTLNSLPAKETLLWDSTGFDKNFSLSINKLNETEDWVEYELEILFNPDLRQEILSCKTGSPTSRRNCWLSLGVNESFVDEYLTRGLNGYPLRNLRNDPDIVIDRPSLDLENGEVSFNIQVFNGIPIGEKLIGIGYGTITVTGGLTGEPTERSNLRKFFYSPVASKWFFFYDNDGGSIYYNSSTDLSTWETAGEFTGWSGAGGAFASVGGFNLTDADSIILMHGLNPAKQLVETRRYLIMPDGTLNQTFSSSFSNLHGGNRCMDGALPLPLSNGFYAFTSHSLNCFSQGTAFLSTNQDQGILGFNTTTAFVKTSEGFTMSGGANAPPAFSIPLGNGDFYYIITSIAEVVAINFSYDSNVSSSPASSLFGTNGLSPADGTRTVIGGVPMAVVVSANQGNPSTNGTGVQRINNTGLETGNTWTTHINSNICQNHKQISVSSNVSNDFLFCVEFASGNDAVVAYRWTGTAYERAEVIANDSTRKNYITTPLVWNGSVIPVAWTEGVTTFDLRIAEFVPVTGVGAGDAGGGGVDSPPECAVSASNSTGIDCGVNLQCNSDIDLGGNALTFKNTGTFNVHGTISNVDYIQAPVGCFVQGTGAILPQ